MNSGEMRQPTRDEVMGILNGTYKGMVTYQLANYISFVANGTTPFNRSDCGSYMTFPWLYDMVKKHKLELLGETK